MSFWNDEDVQDPLQNALQNPDITIDEILVIDTFLQELRLTNEDLIKFLSQEDNIYRLCEWSMTLKDEKNENYDKISRLSTEGLIINKQFIQILLSSAKFQEFINNYLNNPDWDDSCCGHFNRVFLCFMAETNGSFFSRFPTLVSVLKNHIDLISVCELLTTLACDYSKTKLSADILSSLALTASNGSSNAWNCLYVLRQSLPAIIDLNSPTLIKCIQKSARSSEKLIRIESFRLLFLIKQASEASISQQIIESKVPNGEMNSIQGFALSCSVSTPDDAFNILFNRPLHWTAANQMLNILLNLSPLELGKVVNRNNGLQRLQECFDKNDLVPQQLKIVGVLVQNFHDSPVFNEKISLQLRKKAELIFTPYGGDVPRGFQPNSKDLNGE